MQVMVTIWYISVWIPVTEGEFVSFDDYGSYGWLEMEQNAKIDTNMTKSLDCEI